MKGTKGQDSQGFYCLDNEKENTNEKGNRVKVQAI